jgi:hypothetical protein
MTYQLVAVIGPGLREETPSSYLDAVVDVGQRLELVELVPLRLSEDELDFGSYHLNRWALQQIQQTWAGPPARTVVDVETWGGQGYQFACAWSGEAELLAPVTTADLAYDPPGGPWPNPPRRDWAINRALRLLGVTVPAGTFDEFAAIGLGRGLNPTRSISTPDL